jgi:beta-lactam-binding protein with PASTA domain
VKEVVQPRNSFPMPNIIGLTVPEAERQVYSAGRSIGASSANAQEIGRRSDARPAGQIIQQLEPPGTPMRHYTDDVGGNYGEVTFRVVVSTGPSRPTTFPMPNVIGLTVPEAERQVYSAGRSIGASSANAQEIGRRSDARPAGQIIQQLEPPGTPMRRYTDDVGGNYGEVTFRVVVSTGPEPAPNFVGGTVGAARQYAERNDIIVNVGAGQRNSRIPERIVIRQDPAAGQPMPRRRITVYPSIGYPLPNYVEGTVQLARRDSQRLDFELEEQSEDRVDVPYGVIFAQDPGAGTLLPLESPVRVRVSGGWPVPDFIERSEPEAEEIADVNEITLNVTRQDNAEVPAGIIFDQQPLAGERLPRDRTVRVIVSRGYPLPDLEGIHEDEARRIASNLNFVLDISRERLVDRIANHIDSQNPEANTLLPLDRPVSVVVSDGWPTPDFLTLEENEAAALAAARQVNLQITERRRDREVQPGIVIDQDPPPGALLAPTQAVGVVVSARDPTPQLIGLTENEASDLAARRDINLNIRRELSMEFALGLVTNQSPDPGAPLPGDGMVSVVVSTGPPTPDFVGKTEEEARKIASGRDITLVKIAPVEHFELSSGRVIEQRPVAGTVIPGDRRVSISLSLGWPVAPDAVGRPFATVKREFLARHPNVIVEQSENMLTTESAGTVISQHPQPKVKLGPKQRLSLVSSATKPPWLWPVSGVVLIALALGVFAGLKIVLSSSTPESISTEDPGGVRLRVTKDHGVQATEMKDDGDRGREGAEDIVKIRVKVDLGEQSAGPVDD